MPSKNAQLTRNLRLNQAEQRELQSRMERKQMKDFMNVRQSITTHQ